MEPFYSLEYTLFGEMAETSRRTGCKENFMLIADELAKAGAIRIKLNIWTPSVRYTRTKESL